MFRKITFWFSGKSDGESSGSSGRKQPKTKRGRKNKPTFDHETSTSINDTTSPPEVIEVEIIKLSEEQKEILKKSWNVIYSEIGQDLCYVGGDGSSKEESSTNEEANNSPEGSLKATHRGVSETFFRLFEEYPQSRAFFKHLGTSSMDTLKSDLRLSRALQEHAVRVMQVVEKVIGRLHNLEKSKKYLLNLGRFHRHSGIPSDYFGVMGTIFLHAVRPYLEKHEMWSEAVEDAWMELFGHIARVMTYGHIHYHLPIEN